MLVVKRKKGESILIGDNIEINIVSVDSGSVKISINAPKNITVLRKELYKQVEAENRKAIEVNISVLRKLSKK